MSIISNIDDINMSNILFAILHHAVMEIEESSIMGIHQIQFSHDETIGVCLDIFGYIMEIP